MSNILEVSNVSKTYSSKRSLKKYKVIKDISFDIDKGEFVGIMGPSGSGKTTLLNIIGSIDKPTSGKLIINGNDITNLKKKLLAKHRRENIGFIFQDYNLLETMTLKENIILPLSLKGCDKEFINSKADKIINDLGLSSVSDKYPYEVSGGEQQRASAARALITDPSIILADEPTGNLDSKSSKSLLKLLEHINVQYNSTILMVTHDVFAASYCQKVMFIRDGEIYNELYSGEDKKEFFDSIIDVMSIIGGE
ncbi:ABC transporter ATP-binding protein [Clostridiaceae bacterium M8S5]|nr:ABC transporter ATP-binding protein [Clostridiaceae bacterium M8S5]